METSPEPSVGPRIALVRPMNQGDHCIVAPITKYVVAIPTRRVRLVVQMPRLCHRVHLHKLSRLLTGHAEEGVRPDVWFGEIFGKPPRPKCLESLVFVVVIIGSIWKSPICASQDYGQFIVQEIAGKLPYGAVCAHNPNWLVSMGIPQFRMHEPHILMPLTKYFCPTINKINKGRDCKTETVALRDSHEIKPFLPNPPSPPTNAVPES